MQTPWIRWAAAVALGWYLVGPVAAKPPLNVTDFNSLGAFPSGAGTYVFNTSGTPTLQTPDGTVIPGVVADQIAVFTFDAIVIDCGMTLTASGARPLALLSYSDVTIAGTGSVNANGTTGTNSAGGLGGPGGGGGGQGFSAGTGGPGGGRGGGGAAGGGGFGGQGGGSAGGRTYGNLLRGLKGGSGGGGGAHTGGTGGVGGGGGGGGGAIEIVALGDICVGGAGITAMGGNGAIGSGFRFSTGGGGGSGGGIVLKGDSVEVNSILAALGGNGVIGNAVRDSAGGGGGRILILYGAGGFGGTGTIDVSGGNPNGAQGSIDILDTSAGQPGVEGDGGQVSVGSVLDRTASSPSRLLLCGLGVLALCDYTRRRKAAPRQRPRA